MKKKLLTVLLAVVMVFGAFGLVACGSGTNPDDNYNYYSSVYSTLKDETDIRIHSITYLGLERIFTTSGTFLVYIGNHNDANAAANMKAVNDLAKEYDVQVYHFDPILDGGVMSAEDGQPTMDLRDAKEELAASSTALMEMQELALDFMNASSFPSGFMAVNGAAVSWDFTAYDETTAPDGLSVGDEITPTYNGKIAKSATEAAQFESVIQAVAKKLPSYAKPANHEGGTANGAITSAAYDASNINTFDLFNDYRLYMAGDYASATSDYTGESDHVFVTLTYHGFIDLLKNNDGYFAVFFGGTWCPNTQGIAYLTNDLAKDYGINKIYMFDPRWDNGVRLDEAVVAEDENGDLVASVSRDSLNPFQILNSRANEKTGHNTALTAKLADGTASDLSGVYTSSNLNLVQYLDDDGDVINYSYVQKEAAGDAAEVTANVTGLSYFTASGDEVESTFIKSTTVDANGNKEETYKLVDEDYTVPDNTATTTYEKVTLTGYRFTDADMENFNHLYANLLNEIDAGGNKYVSYWNYGTSLTIDGKSYSKMCVPNIMMFNGEGTGNAKLVDYAEAEYFYGNELEAQLWTDAVKAVFDENPYAYYAPLPDAEEAAEEETASDSGSSSTAPAAPAGGAAAGGC